MGPSHCTAAGGRQLSPRPSQRMETASLVEGCGEPANVSVGSNSDVGGRNREVRFTPDNGPPQTATVCPKSAHRFPCNKPPTKDHSATAKHGLKKILRLSSATGATVCFSRLELTLHGSPAPCLAADVVVLPLHTRHRHRQHAMNCLQHCP